MRASCLAASVCPWFLFASLTVLVAFPHAGIKCQPERTRTKHPPATSTSVVTAPGDTVSPFTHSFTQSVKKSSLRASCQYGSPHNCREQRDGPERADPREQVTRHEQAHWSLGEDKGHSRGTERAPGRLERVGTAPPHGAWRRASGKISHKIYF